MPQPLTGGCHCGTLRYRADDIVDTGYCHCRICQHTAGAPVLAWATIPAASYRLERGTPTVYKSSARGERHFCGRCGTQILFKYQGESKTVDINIASFDDPAAVAPEYHIWTQSRIPWFDTKDTLRRFEDDGPDR